MRFPAHLACILLLALAATKAPAGTVPATASTAQEALDFHVIQEDRPLTVGDVCCGGTRFPDAPVSSASAGIGGNPLWIKLPQLRPGTVLVFSDIVDAATLYEESLGGGWTVSRTGDNVSPVGGALPVPRTAFLLSEDADPRAARFLRIDQPNTVRFGLTAWEPQAFRADFERRRIIQMLLIGFITAIILYNLVVSALTRDVVFALNAMTIVALLGIDLYLSGLGGYYVWPRNWSNMVLIGALTGTTVLGVLFISHFLFLDAMHPAARPLHVAAAVTLIVGAGSLVLPYWLPQTALLAIVLIMPLLALAIAVREIFRGNGNARLLMFPLLGIIIPGGGLVFIRSVTDIDFGVVRPHMLEITLAFEALAFSLALAARVRFHKLAAVSARARLAEAEYESARRYADLQERERARIASDLHDSIGHNLVMISGLLERGSRTGVAPEDLASAAGLSKRTVQHVRQISHSLHPSTLSHLGWEAAVESLFDGLERAHGITVNITQTGGTPDLSDGAKLHLYRILQEIVSNIARHAAATRCDASFRNDSATLHIRVADDGVGLDRQKDLQAGLGFASIEQRLKNIGGTWVVNSGGDRGVEVALTIPIEGSGNDGERKTGDGAAR